jgi:hypothetical protein
MTAVERIESFLIHSGLSGPSLDALRPDFPRWLRRLQAMGIAGIPTAPWTAGPSDILAVNLLSLWTLQASPRRDAIATRTKHNLRNLTETRPFKP